MSVEFVAKEVAVEFKRQMSRRHLEIFEHLAVVSGVFVAALVIFAAPDVMASGGGQMPWSSTLTKIRDSIQGPVAQTAGIVAVVVTGIAFAFGEGGGWFKKALGVLFGLSIAFSAGQMISQLGFSGGAVI
jgi:type IV secretion system protein VirB2